MIFSAAVFLLFSDKGCKVYFDGVSGVLQLSLETVGLLLVFGFCHIFCSFT